MFDFSLEASFEGSSSTSITLVIYHLRKRVENLIRSLPYSNVHVVQSFLPRQDIWLNEEMINVIAFLLFLFSLLHIVKFVAIFYMLIPALLFVYGCFCFFRLGHGESFWVPPLFSPAYLQWLAYSPLEHSLHSHFIFTLKKSQDIKAQYFLSSTMQGLRIYSSCLHAAHSNLKKLQLTTCSMRWLEVIWRQFSWHFVTCKEHINFKVIPSGSIDWPLLWTLVWRHH